MPTYSIKCQDCLCVFDIQKKMLDDLICNCSKCGSKNVAMNYSGYEPIVINRLTPKTVGQQAEYNASKLDNVLINEQKAEIQEKHNKELPWYMNGSVPGVKKLNNPLDIEKLVDVKNEEAVKNYIEKGETKT